MSKNKTEKKGMKGMAETAATTATIVVSGKTIASVIDSGVDTIRKYRGGDVAEVTPPPAEPDSGIPDAVPTVTDYTVEERHTAHHAAEPVYRTETHAPQTADDTEDYVMEDLTDEDRQQPVEISDDNEEDVHLLYTEPIDETQQEDTDNGEWNGTDGTAEYTMDDNGPDEYGDYACTDMAQEDTQDMQDIMPPAPDSI